MRRYICLFLFIDILSAWYCLPDSHPLLIYNPETSSRVTLALLGIVFQTKLPTTNNPQPITNTPQPTE